ncbi:hypothetical protein BV25DRAFT_1522425 [Artomyces pyxidatus]|uniref:Uncharacterized protein n=1 Tax=Artomyces pyxidatus TaxID=48021 RepID=A0ACB8TD97_9AGAM|nr:hypothetical protein BV25DRAFT_1522425 [Artomyces pyxidatus]
MFSVDVDSQHRDWEAYLRSLPFHKDPTSHEPGQRPLDLDFWRQDTSTRHSLSMADKINTQLREGQDGILDPPATLTNLASIASTPILSLPPEILTEIFLCCAARGKLFEKRYTDVRGHHKFQSQLQFEWVGWINVTHVCRSWREVALNSASLWSFIDVVPMKPSGFDEMLSRSATTPLSLTISSDRPYIDRWDEAALPPVYRILSSRTLPRLRNLFVQAERGAQDDIWFYELLSLMSSSSVAPLLESLTLHCHKPIKGFELRASQIPLLRSLTVSEWSNFLASSAFENLVELRICPRNHPPSTTDIFPILIQMQRLELFSATMGPPEEQFPTSRSPMPCLKSLQVAGNASCLDFVQHLILPSRCRTRIRPCYPDTNPLVHPVLETFGGIDTPPRALVLRACPSTVLHLQLWGQADTVDMERVWRPNEDLYVEHVDPSATPNLELCVVHYSGDPLLGDEPAPWAGLHLADIVELGLQLTHAAVWTKDRWLAGFRQATRLRTLVARGSRAAQSLVYALAPPALAEDTVPRNQSTALGVASEPDAVLFPVLETIVVRADSPDALISFATFEALAIQLEARFAQGIQPPSKIQIPRFGKDEGRVEVIVEHLKTRAGVATVVVKEE